MTDADLIAEGSRLMESLEFTFKQHYEAERMWLQLHYWIGIPAATASAVAAALTTMEVPEVWPVSLAILAAILIAVSTFIRPDRNAEHHRQAATHMQALHERIRGWQLTEAPAMSKRANGERLGAFRAERATLQSYSPALPKWTYARVKKGLAAGEGSFAVDSPRNPKP